MTIAAEAFMLFIQEAKKGSRTVGEIFSGPSRGVNEQNVISNVYQTGGEPGNNYNPNKNVGAKSDQ